MTPVNVANITPCYQYMFSICSLITNWDEYALMKESFERNGFIDQCEYLIVDNSRGNVMDAYKSINKFLSLSNAKYTIIVHEDVRCLDNYEKLMSVIEKLDLTDNAWAVCGTAGGVYPKKLIFYLKDFEKEKTDIDSPQRVFSLDENFLLIKNAARLGSSNDLNGFHLYGTDICLIANFLGYNCYVINFLVEHLSRGNYTNLDKDKIQFIKSYEKKFPDKIVRTTCLKFYLSNSSIKNKLYNLKYIFFFIKAYYKLRYKVTKRLR